MREVSDLFMGFNVAAQNFDNQNCLIVHNYVVKIIFKYIIKEKSFKLNFATVLRVSKACILKTNYNFMLIESSV